MKSALDEPPCRGTARTLNGDFTDLGGTFDGGPADPVAGFKA
jgi:hypothetical protein